MDQSSKRRGRALPDAVNLKPIAFNLEEALTVENIYRPNLLVINQNEQKMPGEVTLTSRDNAVHILRFLRVWFDVPSNIFFSAVSYLDMFIAKMKIQDKYLNCVTISCFYVAASKENTTLSLKQLITVTQTKCSIKDLLRMVSIIKDKLKLDNNETKRITTAADILKLYIQVFECVTRERDSKFISVNLLEQEALLTRLEVILADSSSAFFRSSAVALVLIQIEIEKCMAQGLPSKSVHFLGEMLHLLTVVRDLQYTCKIKTAELKNCYTNVSRVLKLYESQCKSKHHQKLFWCFSSSTVDKSYKHRNFKLYLHTIQE